MEKYKDNFSIQFESKMDTERFFTEQYLNDLWLNVDSKDIIVHIIDPLPIPLNWENENHAEEVIKSMKLSNCTAGALMNSMTKDGTQIYVEVKGYGNFLVRPTALDGLKFRAGQEGKATEVMYNKRRADYYPEQINKGMEVMGNKVKILIRDEKITAMNSGIYAILPTTELLAELTDVLDTRFPGAFFTGAQYDHYGMSMSYILPQQAEELLRSYKDALSAAGHKALAMAAFMPAISFTTTDIGVSSATIRAQIQCSTINNNDFCIEIGDAVRLIHKDGATAQKFHENAELLFAAFCDQSEKLSALLDVEIGNVENCIRGLCSRLNMPVGVLKYATENYECMGATDTAHDVFWAVCGAVSHHISEKALSGHDRIRLEEAAARMLLISHADWRELEMKKATKYAKKEED